MPSAPLASALAEVHVFDVDWKSVFVPEHPLELFVRGSLMYLALFALIRIVIRRRMGSLAPTDLLVVVLLADAAQNGMAGHYDSLPDGILLCATIIFWATLLDWLGYRSPLFRRVLEPEPLRVVHQGRLQLHNMKKEMLGEDEVLSLLRQNGISDLQEVASAYLEPDGHLSVLRADEKASPPKSIEPSIPV